MQLTSNQPSRRTIHVLRNSTLHHPLPAFATGPAPATPASRSNQQRPRAPAPPAAPYCRPAARAPTHRRQPAMPHSTSHCCCPHCTAPHRAISAPHRLLAFHQRPERQQQPLPLAHLSSAAQPSDQLCQASFALAHALPSPLPRRPSVASQARSAAAPHADQPSWPIQIINLSPLACPPPSSQHLHLLVHLSGPLPTHFVCTNLTNSPDTRHRPPILNQFLYSIQLTSFQAKHYQTSLIVNYHQPSIINHHSYRHRPRSLPSRPQRQQHLQPAALQRRPNLTAAALLLPTTIKQ